MEKFASFQDVLINNDFYYPPVSGLLKFFKLFSCVKNIAYEQEKDVL